MLRSYRTCRISGAWTRLSDLRPRAALKSAQRTLSQDHEVLCAWPPFSSSAVVRGRKFCACGQGHSSPFVAQGSPEAGTAGFCHGRGSGGGFAVTPWGQV